MSSGADLHRALLDVLKGIGHLTVHDGSVPKDTARPYAVLWSSAGTALTEEAADRAPVTGLEWQGQITVGADTQAECLDAAATVRTTVLGLVLVPGATRLRELGDSRFVAFDEDITPPRPYVPIPVHCQTP